MTSIDHSGENFNSSGVVAGSIEIPSSCILKLTPPAPPILVAPNRTLTDDEAFGLLNSRVVTFEVVSPDQALPCATRKIIKKVAIVLQFVNTQSNVN